jgi:hypothetical protein
MAERSATELKEDRFLAATRDYRVAAKIYATAPDIPFYDKLRVLFAAQPGGTFDGFSRSAPAIDYLRRTESGNFILVQGLGGLVMGVLEAEGPWSIAITSQRGAGNTGQDLGLRGRFAHARRLDGMHTVYGAGPGSGRDQRIVGADVTELDDPTVIVDFGDTPIGPENFAARVATIDRRVAIGLSAIHGAISEVNLPNEQRLELHAAASMAAGAMSIERARAGAAVKG